MNLLNFFSYSALFNAFVAGLLGVVIILKNRKELINKLFFGLSFSVVFWSFSYWEWMTSQDAGTAILWVRLLSIGSLFVPIFYFHWIITFTNYNKLKKSLIKFIYAIATIFLIFSFSDLFIKNVEKKYIFSFWPNAGFLYSLYLLLIYLGLTIYTLVILFKKYKENTGSQKRAIFYIILSSFIGFGGGITNFFLWYDIPIYPYGNVLVSLYPVALAIAIFKYQLFNVKVIAAELLTFAIWIVILLEFLFSKTLNERVLNGSIFLLVILFGIFLIRSVEKEVKQREQIEELATRLKQVNSVLAHDVKGAFAKGKGALSLFLDGSLGPVPDQAKPLLTSLSADWKKMLDAITNILAAGRDMVLSVEPFNLKDVVLEVIKDATKDAEAKHLTIQTNILEGDYGITADKTQLTTHVIKNLIENAINYNLENGTITIGLSRKDNQQDAATFLFTVKDTGVGITEEDKPKMFKEAGQGKNSMKVNVHSSGYGLFTAKKTVDAHGGKIWFESAGIPGKGTTFFVELPVAGKTVNG